MAISVYNRGALTGGGATALDAISVGDLSDGDRALVFYSDKFYVFEFDASATDAEASPVYIRPDDYSTSGVWKQKRWSDAPPVGSVLAFPAETPPTGYLECNGAAISRTAYPELYTVLGTSHGVGDGSTTFNLPDYRGRFLRGWANGATLDPDRASRTDRGDGTTGDHVGTKQGAATARPNTAFTTDTTAAHSHSIPTTYSSANSNVDCTSNDGTGWQAGNPQTGTAGAHAHSVTGGGDSETRPVNINVMWCIKYE